MAASETALFDEYRVRRQAAAPLTPPAQGSIPVAFVISERAVIIDFCGPWEVFEFDAAPEKFINTP
jgi:hypothetical protein